MISISKNGGRDKATSNGPISLNSLSIQQVFEKILHIRIYSYEIRLKLLSEYHFGFRKKSSTTTAISKTYDEILNNIGQKMYNFCIFLDLKKAFDTVDHNLSIQQLEFNYGFRGIARNIMKSYVTSRK